MTTVLERPVTPTTPDPTLTTYSAFVRRYRWLLVAGVVVGLVAGALVHLGKPVRFTSSTDMVIVATRVTSGPDTERDVTIDSALELLRSDRVIGRVARELDYAGGVTELDADLITRPLVNSRIVRISVNALDPDIAQVTVTALADRFFEVRRRALDREAEVRAEALAAEVEAVEAELAELYGLPTDAQEAVAGDVLDTARTPVADIGRLVALRAQLHGEQASLATAHPEPGYVSRPAAAPRRGARSGLAITMSSALTLSLLAAVCVGALHHGRTRQTPAVLAMSPRGEGERHDP